MILLLFYGKELNFQSFVQKGCCGKSEKLKLAGALFLDASHRRRGLQTRHNAPHGQLGE